MLPIASLRRQLPKIQLCLLATDRLTRSSSSRQLHHPDEPNRKTHTTMYVLKGNSSRQRRRQVAAINESQFATAGVRLKVG